MIKKLACAIVAVVVVTLAASPAQANPAKQRARQAAVCIDDFIKVSDEVDLVAMEAALYGLSDKCYSIVAISISADRIDALPESLRNPTAMGEDFVERVLRKYRVTRSQVGKAQYRLGFSYD